MSDSVKHADDPTPSRHEQFEVHLRKISAGWFTSKGFAVSNRYPYLLADRNDWRKNIILPEVADYVCRLKEERERQRINFPLHKYVHHGLSSQAMLFNLVGPLVARDDLTPLARAFQAMGITWPGNQASARFEVEDREVFHEDRGQPTSLDLVIGENHASGSLFVEAKFAEREFGGCSVFQRGDCDGRNPAHDYNICYLHQIGRKYWDRLSEHGFLTGAFLASPICPLATYYQFFREVLFALHLGGCFVLLHDARNPTFSSNYEERGLYPFLRSFVPDRAQDRVKQITVQQVLDVVRHHDNQTDWTHEFSRKYGM